MPSLIRRLMTFKMTPKQYLLFQALGSIAVNFFINAGFAWLNRHMEAVPLWGRPGIAFDTLLTTFLLSALTVLFGTVFISRDYRHGRFSLLPWTRKTHWILRAAPYALLSRAVLFGVVFTVACVPPTLAIFALAHVDALSYPAFFAFKVIYAIVLGLVVTPLNALWVVTTPRTFRVAAAGVPDTRM